jgi:low affinity Fe/Cu permease
MVMQLDTGPVSASDGISAAMGKRPRQEQSHRPIAQSRGSGKLSAASGLTMKSTDPFSRAAKCTARAMGQPAAFVAAVLVVVVWGVLGPLYHFSDTWQLVINTGTTIVTFLMVFLIQNTQNRDSAAIQVKLDELIRTSKAHNVLLNLEELSQKDLERIKQQYEHLAEVARAELKAGKRDTNSPLVKTG